MLASMFVLTACNDNDNNDAPVEPPIDPPAAAVNYSYEVKVTNLTQAQPMSPLAVVLHNEGNIWTLGESASVALENLAESGDNTDVLAMNFVNQGESGAGILPPGGTESLTITMTDEIPQLLSLATMLVNTNDAFTGVNAMDVSNLAVNESISLRTSSYDSGTENNSEMSGTIPGPADTGGEGFNAARDDVDFVAMHAGVVSSDDGLTQSILTFDHRFDNPTLAVTITRIE
jgi:hypothetical protein